MKKITHSYPSWAFQLMAHMTPHIRISPFLPDQWAQLMNHRTRKKQSLSEPSFWLDKATALKIFYSGRSALYASLRNENLRKDDEVLIITTTQGPYISSCVTQTIEKVCRWTRSFSKKTRAALVIHEFGFPCDYSLVKSFKDKEIPIIEDCAYAIGSRISKAPLGTFGDYAFYSLPKYYPIPFGGILAAKKKIKNQERLFPFSKNHTLIMKTINNASRFHHQWNLIRRRNWYFFADYLRPYHIEPYIKLTDKIIPGVFLTKVPKGFNGGLRKKNLIKAGVEATEYYGQGGFYFPVHQFLTEYEKRYILKYFLNAA